MQKRAVVIEVWVLWISELGKTGARFLMVEEGNYKHRKGEI